MKMMNLEKNNLKSNMDRFIGNENHFHALYELYLKSNMDRFIVAVTILDIICFVI